MIHADLALARRLESLICTEFHRLAEVARGALPAGDAECIDLGGGVALWLGEGSPVNQGAAQAMGAPVDDKDIELLEAFYHKRGAVAVTSVCPLADPSLICTLGQRGWTATEFEHLLVMELESRPPAGGPRDGVEVRVCASSERESWAHIAAVGFADGRPPAQGYDEFGRIMVARDEAILVMGYVDGQPAGTGALVVDGGVGWLAGDSTLPHYRRRGLQQAVQRFRLQLARDAGCELAVTEAAPGSGSHRNMERMGFRIAYTHVEFAKPATPTADAVVSGR